MPRHLNLTKFIIISSIVSLALHALLITGLFLIEPERSRMPASIPVEIVDLPRDLARKQPLPAPPPPRPRIPKPTIPEKPLPPGSVPKPKKFGEGDGVTLPKTGAIPRTGVPEGAEEGKEKGATTPLEKPKPSGPLPFLSQNDIDQLARRGMPAKKPGDESVTLDTDEFKFISYNRWLKVKVESEMKYPELAAISGYQGTLFIKFDILKNGSLGGLEVLKSSGYKILDDEALRSIRASAPFQPLPDEWQMERYSIRAAVIFYLGQGYIR
jgi:protein TonB